MRSLRPGVLCLVVSLVPAIGYAQGVTPPPEQPDPQAPVAPQPAPPEAAGSATPNEPPTANADSPMTSSPTPTSASADLGELEVKLQSLRAEGGLTAETVAARTMESSAQLEAKRASIEAAAATEDQVMASYWPRLTLTASYTRLSPIDTPVLGSGTGDGALIVTAQPATAPRPVAPGEQLLAVPSPEITLPVVLNNYALGAHLSVPLSDYVLRVSHGLDAAKRGREAVQLEEQATRLSLARDGRVAYYRWIQAQAAVIIAEQSLAQAQGHHTDASNAFAAGMVSRADVWRAEAQVQNAELFVIRTQNARDLARQQIAVLMSDASDAQYTVGEDAFAQPAELEQLPTLDEAVSEASRSRLELQALAASESARKEQAQLAKVGNYPRLEAQANAIYANPNQRIFPIEEKFTGTWDVGVVLSWTPTDIAGAQASEAQASAQARELAATRAAVERGLRLEVAQALSSASEAKAALGVSAHVLRAAEESYRVRRELFRAGRATLVELTDAETELTRARIDLVNARVGAKIALVQLHHAMGRDGPVSGQRLSSRRAL